MNRKEHAEAKTEILDDLLGHTPWNRAELIAAIRHDCDRSARGNLALSRSIFVKILKEAHEDYKRNYCRFCHDNDDTATLCCTGHDHLLRKPQ